MDIAMYHNSFFAGFNDTPVLAAMSLIVGIVLLVIMSAIFPRMNPQEPPSIRPKIPFIGHVVGLFRHQVHYFDMLNDKYGLHIYTLPMLTGKTYVVASPDLVQSILKVKSDGLSVEPFMINVVGKNLSDQSPEAMKVWSRVSEDKSEPYLLRDYAKAFSKQLAVPQQRNELNSIALSKFSSLVDSIRASKEENLYIWLRNNFSISATTALYGPANPMAKDASLCDAQWDMEAKSLWVFIGLFNKLLFPKAFAGRAAVQAAHGAYHEAKHSSSSFMNSITDILRQYGLTNVDIGKADVSVIHGSTSNAALAFYWFVVYVFADATLLNDLRAELLSVTTEQEVEKGTATGRREMRIDVSSVASTCPLLCAVHQEVLRLQTFSLVTRFVAEDTMISDSQEAQYLLKAGAILQMPSAVSQASVEVWGPDAHRFKARRFLRTDDEKGEKEVLTEAGKEREKLQKKAYFPFSGGVHRCPGRHFATAEHLGMVAMLILGFEITTVDGKKITIPQNPEGQRGISSGVGKPNAEFMKLQVRVQRRKGLEDVNWTFKVAEEK